MGSGTLILTGSNTYSGATTVNSGTTLEIGGNNALPNAAGTAGITVNGTLDLAGYSPAGQSERQRDGHLQRLRAGDAERGHNNQSSTFSGAIQDGVGSVALTKIGTGTLTFSGSELATAAGRSARARCFSTTAWPATWPSPITTPRWTIRQPIWSRTDWEAVSARAEAGPATSAGPAKRPGLPAIATAPAGSTIPCPRCKPAPTGPPSPLSAPPRTFKCSTFRPTASTRPRAPTPIP